MIQVWGSDKIFTRVCFYLRGVNSLLSSCHRFLTQRQDGGFPLFVGSSFTAVGFPLCYLQFLRFAS